jgi:peptidyl-prolyl cis-trans isomerase D
MSIIQQLREKYAAVGIGFIALSLIGFLLMDSAGNNNSGGVDPQDAIGEINGRSISYSEFMNRTKSIENMQAMNGRTVDEELRQQINGEVWRQMVERTLLEEEYAKLGIQVTNKEFNDLLFGANPPEWLTQQFTDPNTGQFDVAGAKQAINEIKKNRAAGNAEMIEQFYLDPLLEQTLRNKYVALQRNSAYVPKFLAEKTLSDNAASAAFRYVQIPFSSIPDSTVVISDAMINKYVSEHKRDFRQEESMRSIAYVSFPFNPSANDSATVLSEILALREGFVTAENPGEYVARNGSTLGFADDYFSKERIQIAQKDSIIAAGVGNVYGPYLDGNSYVLSRVVDVKTRPDSVKARHILISTMDMQTQQVTMSDSAAKAKIDSIEAAINGGSSFAALATQFSTDQGSAQKGGDLGYFASGMMVKEFNDFCFDKTKGSRGVVKTQFGYHLIEITDQKNFVPAYKIAYLAKPIDASMETVNDAMNAANQFAGSSRDLKSFDANIIKQGFNKLVAPDIRENEYNIMGLGVNRALVREVFEAKVGSVLDPVELNNQYIVVAVTGAEESGVMSAAKARPMVESILRNEEKAKKIIAKLGKVTTLEAVANANSTIIQQADSVMFVSPMIGGLGFEPKVAGFAFAKSNLNKVSQPIAGNSGVFVIQTTQTGATQSMGGSMEETRNTLMGQAKGVASTSSMQALRDRGSITDKRSKFL